MNWLDAVLILILLISVATSFRKGLSREVIGLVTVVFALLAGAWFYGVAGGWLAPFLSSRGLANFLGFGMVFAAVMLLGVMVSFTIGRMLKLTGLSLFDRILGAAFGIVRGVLVGVALILGLMAFTPGGGPPSSVVHSRMAPYVVDAARFFASMAPHELREGFRKSYAQVKLAWSKAVDKGLRGVRDGDKKENERKL